MSKIFKVGDRVKVEAFSLSTRKEHGTVQRLRSICSKDQMCIVLFDNGETEEYPDCSLRPGDPKKEKEPKLPIRALDNLHFHLTKNVLDKARMDGIINEKQMDELISREEAALGLDNSGIVGLKAEKNGGKP